MFEYLLTPLHTHYDLGFGAVANAYKMAADELSGKDSLLGHLPVGYLRRHAIELYLKSGIIIFHKKLSLPYGQQPPESDPRLPTSKGWKPLYENHSIRQLYSYWRELFEVHKDFLAANTHTDWSFPEDLTKLIDIIEGTDPESTFLRYPVTKNRQGDKRKSASQEASMDSLMKQMKRGGKPVKAFLVTDQDDNVISSYQLLSDPASALNTALATVASCLYDTHAAMRGELTGGW
jgi:hypothetical protein